MGKNETIILGISIGDLNGIGPEVVLKAFEDPRMLDFCTPSDFCLRQINQLVREAFPNHDTN